MIGSALVRGLILSTLAWSSASAWGWNATGHRLVAGIAWSLMTPSARSEATRLLDAHPDRARWFGAGEQTIDGRTAFIVASTWPDDIRRDPRFFTPATEQATPLQPGFPDMERHTRWHTLAPPLDALSTSLSPTIAGEHLGTAITTQSNYFEHHAPDTAAQAYALPWLIHLAGDAHQPLHVSVRRDTDGEWDWFGTRFRVRDPAGAGKPAISLHTYWDDLGGPRKLQGDALDKAVVDLIAHHPQSDMEAETPVQQWLDESWRIAQTNGYPGSDYAAMIIDDSFREQSRSIAERRITQAGYRLGRLLNRLLAVKPFVSPQ